VLLIGDRLIVCAGVRLLIEKEPAMEVLGEIRCHLEDLDKIQEKPDVVLVDLDSNERDCLASLSNILERVGEARVLVLTGTCDSKLCSHLAHLGILGVVSTKMPVDILIKAIRTVHAGEMWFDRSTMASLVRNVTRPRLQHGNDLEAVQLSTLTRREREIIECLGRGLDAGAISRQLFISKTTVRHHLTSILDKLGVHDRFELVFYAYRHGLAAPPV
jgi:DNA-binding NarL/FixJ family response regulator